MNLKKYIRILKNKGLRYSVKEFWKLVQRFHWIRDNRILADVYEDKAYRYLHRYKYVLQQKPAQTVEVSSAQNKIWVCWLQGIDKAPLLVQRCVASIKKNSAGREVIVLTHDNLGQYLSLPDYILTKYRKKQITHTHFSDIVRISLLAEHGGVWIDSTVLLTEQLPEYIVDSPLFAFKTSMFASQRTRASNWLMAAAKPQNKIICAIRDLIYEYWRKEIFVKHYFIFHLFVAMVIDSSEENKRLWKEIPYYNNVNPHVLQFELFDKYDKARWDEICRISSVHKLTYKIPDSKKSNVAGTYYEKLLAGEL